MGAPRGVQMVGTWALCLPASFIPVNIVVSKLCLQFHMVPRCLNLCIIEFLGTVPTANNESDL